MVEVAIPPEKQQVIDRLTALLLTVPGWPRNDTATQDDAAQWVIAEAGRVGWTVQVTEKEGAK